LRRGFSAESVMQRTSIPIVEKLAAHAKCAEKLAQAIYLLNHWSESYESIVKSNHPVRLGPVSRISAFVVAMS
jgi:hypothetical protein